MALKPANNNNGNAQDFVPAKWIENPHLQTILPRMLRRHPLFEPTWQRVNTPDGDFLDLCWTEPPNQAMNKPIVVLFHGLAGSFYSPYANGLLHSFKQQGWLGVLMHFRSCSGQTNKQPYSYHSGQTQDARFILELLAQKYQRPMVAVGVSLGGNMLIQYLSQYSQQPIIKAGVAISPPLDLAACSARLQQGFSRVYQRYLLQIMNKSLAKKLLQHQQIGKITQQQRVKFSSIYQFDDLVTAPLHGFVNADDYYAKCSGIKVLNNIQLPVKIIHAKDDPFMTDAVVPNLPLNSNIEYHLTEHGGHVGFISGSIKTPSFWLEQEVPRWLSTHLL